MSASSWTPRPVAATQTLKISELEHVSSLPFFSQKTKKPKVAESVSKSEVSEGKMLKRSPCLAKIKP